MSQTKISNKDLKKPLIGEDITLGSGINILPATSGASNLGSPAFRFGVIYADSLVGPSSSGSFVSTSGGTMTGNLVMSGANIVPQTSGVGNLGSAGAPFNTIFSQALAINGVDLQNVFVNVTGDTMTGPLAISSGNLTLANGTISSSGNITTTNGSVFVTFPNAVYTSQIVQSLGGGSGISILDTNGTPGGIIYLSTAGGVAGGKITLNADFGTSSTGLIDLHTDGFGGVGGYSVKLSGTELTLDSGVNILTTVSGGSNVGSPSKPFGTIYANSIVSTGSEGAFVNVTGDTMTGDLVIQTRLNVGSGNTLFGTNSSVFGTNSKASGNNSIAFGSNGIAQGVNSLAIGDSVGYGLAQGLDSIALYGNAYGDGSLAHGFSNVIASEAYGDGAVAIGYGSKASGNGALAGGQSTSIGAFATSFGSASKAMADNAFAVGIASVASGNGSIAMGNSAIAKSDYSIALGNSAEASGNGSFAVGNGAQTFGIQSVAIGNGTAANDSNSFALGQGATANGSDSFAIGLGATTTTGNSMVMAFTNGVYLDSSNLYPLASGTQDIGSLTLPFSGIFTNNIKSLISIIAPTTPPSSGTAPGTTGQIVMGTDGYFYGCSGTNLWGRVQLTSF